MKRLLLGLALTLNLVGCAHTTLFANGKPILRTEADATNLTYSGHGIRFHADSLNHSGPTIAGGASARNVINGAAALTSAAGAAFITKGLAPVR